MRKLVFPVLACVLTGAHALADDLENMINAASGTSAASASQASGIIGNMSVAGLIWGLIFSSVGLFAFLYGKKKENVMYMVIGGLLCGYSYVVQDTTLVIVIGAVLSGALYFFKR